VRQNIAKWACGRFLSKLPVAEIASIFGTKNALPNYPARFNIAPTDPVLGCASMRRSTSRRPLRWSLMPHWVKDLKFPSALAAKRWRQSPQRNKHSGKQP
jgi:putative SOS response-associated peptidase YedK